MAKILFQNQTSNGESERFVPTGSGGPGFYNKALLNIYGTFGGCSIELQYLADDNNWYSTGDKIIISPISVIAKLGSTSSYRLKLTGATGSTDISAKVDNAQ